jgi:membrane dipeptidase
MFIVDAHLDLSMNALEWNRDLRQPVEAIRARARHLTDKRSRSFRYIRTSWAMVAV